MGLKEIIDFAISPISQEAQKRIAINRLENAMRKEKTVEAIGAVLSHYQGKPYFWYLVREAKAIFLSNGGIIEEDRYCKISKE